MIDPYGVREIQTPFQVPGLMPAQGAPPTVIKTWCVTRGGAALVTFTGLRLEFSDEEAARDFAEALNEARCSRMGGARKGPA